MRRWPRTARWKARCGRSPARPRSPRWPSRRTRGCRELFFELVAGQVPAAEQHAPQPLAALEVVLDGLMAALRHHAELDRVAELPGQLEALSLQCLTPFFGADEARRVASLVTATPHR
jgi:hypothetical protein